MRIKLNFFLSAIMIFFLVVVCMDAPGRADIGGDTIKATAANATANDGKVASVNGAVISRNQFDNALEYQKEMAAIRGVSVSDEQLPTLKYQVLENLISQELLYQESQQYGIKIDEKEIDDTFNARKQRANFKTDAEFEEALKKTNKSVASYREEIKQGLAIDRFVQNKFTDHTVVSDLEAKNYYDNNTDLFRQPAQVRISHIMARLNSNADQSQKDEARSKIEKALERIRAGEDFAAVAREVSEDANSKDDGGDLGYLSKGQAPQSFEDAAFALKADEISGIVETGSGYHVIKLTDREEARTVGYEEAKDDIVNLLKTNKVNSSIDGYIQELKIKSTIVTYPISQ